MKESVEKLLKKMNENKKFAEKILSQSENEKVIQIAKDADIELTIKDIEEANKIIYKAVKNQNEGELSEEELESVAGGTMALASIAVGVTVVASAAGAVSLSLSASASLTMSAASLMLAMDDDE